MTLKRERTGNSAANPLIIAHELYDRHKKNDDDDDEATAKKEIEKATCRAYKPIQGYDRKEHSVAFEQLLFHQLSKDDGEWRQSV
ncbi:MAG: hypothetical protein M1813_004357 [Trichoglossum hirsutum]|jgi:hypothetical protein|nr:MAG: hypothetical protein M1813_004357 [Trichoglossum hirsutum]